MLPQATSNNKGKRKREVLQASRAGVLPLVLAVARGQMSAEEANAAMASVASQDGAAGETAAERVPDARAPASALAASVRG